VTCPVLPCHAIPTSTAQPGKEEATVREEWNCTPAALDRLGIPLNFFKR